MSTICSEMVSRHRTPLSPETAARIRNFRNFKSIVSHGIVFLLGVFAVSMFCLERKFLFTITNQSENLPRIARMDERRNFFQTSLALSSVSSENPKHIPGFASRDSATSNNLDNEVDKRLEVPRPFMQTTSRSIVDSIYDIERRYETDAECNAWGGSKFMEELDQSVKSLVHGGKSNLLSFRNRNMDAYFGENVSIVVTMQGDYTDETEAQPVFRLEVDGTFEKPLDKRLHSMEHQGTLGKMGWNTLERKGITECTDYIEHPVMLVDNTINTWNWWFFLQAILHHYIAFAIVQPQLVGDYLDDSLRVMFSSDDKRYSRSFLDAFEFMFSDRRTRDSRQIWHIDPSKDDGKSKRYCFRKLLWAPGNFGGTGLLVNKYHGHMDCFSSIIYSYAAYMKAAMHIPTLPRPVKPRVVWVGRDTSIHANPSSWQQTRIISNQQEVISYLRDECAKLDMELIVADFYGDKKDTPFQEQVAFVSRANIMIGMHGAGLNMFHFMPFNSVVVELHGGTDGQMNSANFVNHIREGAYLSTSADIDEFTHKLRKEPVWDILQEAINEWENLGSQEKQKTNGESQE